MTVTTGIARDAGLAGLIARAEAVERYAAGDLGRRPLVRAAASELHGAVSLDAFHLSNARQLEAEGAYEAFEPDEMHLWTPAVTAGGATRWVPGRAVHYPFDDPERSETAAGRDQLRNGGAHGVRRGARTRLRGAGGARRLRMDVDAVGHRELVEHGSLPPKARSLVEALSGHGFEVALVNLTLETAPVILAVAYDEHRLGLGAACHPRASAAATKALEEVSRVAFMGTPTGEPPAPEEVTSPHDHLLLHQGAGRRADHGFLFSSTERISLGEIEGLDRPLFQELGEFGEPLVVDLTSPSTRPFHVVRALVPGTDSHHVRLGSRVAGDAPPGRARQHPGRPRAGRAARLGAGRARAAASLSLSQIFGEAGICVLCMAFHSLARGGVMDRFTITVTNREPVARGDKDASNARGCEGGPCDFCANCQSCQQECCGCQGSPARGGPDRLPISPLSS